VYLKNWSIFISVPEPVEQQLFAGAGAEVFWPGSALGMEIHIKCYKNPKFFIHKFEVEFNNFFRSYFRKQPIDDHLCSLKT
jgi:hypothetical protein